MKKVISFSLIFLAAVFIFSCKKGDSAPSYHVSCSVNGKATTFNVDASVSIDSTGSTVTGIEIDGATSADANTAGIDIGVYGDAIVAGSYADNSNKFQLSSDYYPSVSGSSNYYSGTDVQSDAASNSITITNGLKIVFTSITKTAVQGTFSGDYYADGSSTGTPIHITNGSFYVKAQ